MVKAFKIVKIINEYRVVVNAGSNDLIRDNQTLEVYVPGREIIDPDSGDSLGTLDYVKAKLRVVDVFPKMCVCENRNTEPVISLMTTLSSLQRQEALPLAVDSKEISGGYEGIDKKIHVGDLVREAGS